MEELKQYVWGEDFRYWKGWHCLVLSGMHRGQVPALINKDKLKGELAPDSIVDRRFTNFNYTFCLF